MKKLSVFAVAMLFALATKGQLWFDLGIKGGYTPGMSINSNVFNDAAYKVGYDHSYLFGGKIGINFNAEHAITIDGLLTSIGNSREVEVGPSTLESNLRLNYLEIPILYRHNKENGSYAEIGPQIGLLQGATVNGSDAKSQFNGTNFGVALGTGQYIGGGNLFGLNLGVRIAYMFNDIVGSGFQSEAGSAVYAPVGDSSDSFSYKGTTNFYAGIVAEFNFNFGYFVKGSGCHKNTRFKLF